MGMAPLSGRQVRTIVAGAIGNVLEWYDFGLFGYFAWVFSDLFFPKENSLAGLLDVFAIFAVAFLMRPVGGVIFGYIGDRLGRKRALELSVLLMAIPTTLVGLLPTYAQVGVVAPLLLTFLRVLQGISVGGEFIGSMSFLAEHAQPGQRGFLASWTGASATGGTLLGSGMAALVTRVVPHDDLLTWGWRLPFLCGLGVGLAGLWVRRGMTESDTFTHAAKAGALAANPVLEALRRDFRSVAATLGLALMMSIGFYLPFVWLATWLSKVLQPPLPESDALTANTLAMMGLVVLSPAAGALSDRLGRKRVMLAGAAVYLFGTYPLFLLLGQGTFTAAVLGGLTFAVGSALFSGPCTAAFVELFPTRTRLSGIALGYNGAQALFGGTSPMVATWLIEVTGYGRMPALYLIAAAAVAGLTVLCIKDRHKEPLR